MSSLPPLKEDEFSQFFQALHGVEPFPWQKRLLQQVTREGWPAVLDLPTGFGKTAALDVAVFSLALEADRASRTAPRRIIYVVDRRTIVDQAFQRAERIRSVVAESDHDVIRRVRQRLAARSYDGIPLRTALLRGGIARDDAWARTPDQPLVAVSTVDQVGSRLLFRGYGVSDSMKPVHAGLLGSDVLYLLDEVHLSQPFKETLTAIRDQYEGWAERSLAVPFIVVEMSATPGDPAGTPFGPDEDDWRHPRLSERAGAAKPAALVSVNGKALLSELEQRALGMLDRPGATVAVVVNRVGTARELHDRLQRSAGDRAAVHLLTGRMRPFDRDRIERTLLPRICAGRHRRVEDHPTIVVATQAIEAGADFDFDALVTECASLDALRQRFGRVDRLGKLAGAARSAIVATTSLPKDDPVYGGSIEKTWQWLNDRASDGSVDFGINALSVPSDAAAQGLLSPKAHAPILLPTHLDAWVQTAPIPEPDPEVALWLHGPERGLPDVQVVWRADVSFELLAQAAGGETPDARRAKEIALGLVEALPPTAAEAMSVPLVAVRRWLMTTGEEVPDFGDVEGARVEDDVADGRSRPVVLWRGDDSDIGWGNDVKPGETIVIPVSYGGIGDHSNWAPLSTTPVHDIAEVARLAVERSPVVRLHPDIVPLLFGPGVACPLPPADDEESADERVIVADWLEAFDAATVDPSGALLIDLLRREVKGLRVERVPFRTPGLNGEYFLVTIRPVAGTTIAASDDLATDGVRSSFSGRAVTLERHLAGVAGTVASFAASLSLPADITAVLRSAAEWHDSGKADVRFQRWLHGGSEFKALVQAEPLAKAPVKLSGRVAMTRARERSGYPRGGRHELTSVALLRAAGEGVLEDGLDRVLMEHLVASHHGHCRPFAPYVPDETPVPVTFTRDGTTCRASSAHGLEHLASGIADGFWASVRRYGWWGTALLEACLRLADHRQSESEQQPGRRSRG